MGQVNEQGFGVGTGGDAESFTNLCLGLGFLLALEGLALDTVKGHIVMRACDHQAEQPGFIVKVVKKEGMEHPMPEVIATYAADRVTPPCNKMVYDN